jgi:DNA-binding response OmpR family regulator
MQTVSSPPSSDAIPPIVLLLESDRETLELYSASFRKAGVWVAGLDAADAALDAVKELRPDAIVTAESTMGAESAMVVTALKEDTDTSHIPLIVLKDDAAGDGASAAPIRADLVLTKPVMPAALLDRIQELIVRSHELRARSTAAESAHEAAANPRGLVEKSRGISAALDASVRRCPSCHRPLEWIADHSGAFTYDYYRWCRTGCGLYCYDRSPDAERNWIKLA